MKENYENYDVEIIVNSTRLIDNYCESYLREEFAVHIKDEGALVVFSGGQDSTTCLFWALERFAKVEAVTFDYGQRHSKEIECAKKICADLGVQHTILDMSLLGQLTENALTRDNIKVEAGEDGHLPSTFVDGRNMFCF